MTLLIIGVALWMAAHFFKRVLPEVRAAMGDKGKGLVAVATIISIVLMVIGYRGAEVVPVYTPMAGMGHLNNLLMLISIFLLGAGSVNGPIGARIRHPMMWGMIVWGVAHLLVNGDQASLVLFGGLIGWALVQMAMINRGEGAWQRPVAGPAAKDIKNLVITLVLYGIISGIHIWLGYNPFSGAYA